MCWKKYLLTCIKRSCNYNFLTFGIGEKQAHSFHVFRISFRPYALWIITTDRKKMIPFDVSVWRFQTLRSNYYMLINFTLGCFQACVWTFQVGLFPHDNDGSTYRYMKILRRPRSVDQCTVNLKWYFYTV